ncbi:MAG TPA: RodZ domain-containing protein [Stellaceae bacterium]|nr:RodZ domain-containing protein [Stellaceae bacterium]
MTFFQRIKTPFSESPGDEQARLQPRMRLIGELLQERREDLGLDLDEIGAMLRIKPAYLAALEQGRTRDLPGPTYAIGFVRAYADFLGLDSEAVLVRFKTEAAGVTARPDLALPVPLGERSLPGGALVLVALIVALCGYGIWYYLSTEERSRPERVAAVPAALQAPPASVAGLSAPPADSVSNAPAPASSTPGAGANLATGALLTALPRTAPSSGAPPPATPAAAPATPAPPSQAAQQAAPPPQASAPPQTASVTASTPATATTSATPAPAAIGKITIKALADCWIQVRAADQSLVFSRVLRAGETYAVPQRSGLALRTGNAGALELAVDGKAVPSIGGIGALRRDVVLDPAELAAGTAVHG